MFINIPSNVQFIISTFYNNNCEAFIVGGCVRDCLLGKIPNDYDITTSATPDIIEKLFSTFLIEKKGKELHITSKGKQLLDLVPVDLKSPELTASWEKKLQDISKGKLNKNVFIK